ncbi:MAG TPA: polyribonucleotide nucleotidyltransferase [Geminicoccus sp.]|uniref:polyribonucleotide nucleotidyltransferase n=1 Tax=Geminicoccus sp. TaxID=2024832 RepID=UPI002E331C0E|nr:polyribonucleotide nucleotidyltransferase [Geminicoccus sp.]HEX2526249.1 polyribonucleotide nucleotidyltransferase [Geminicoccus sp.]
MFNLTRKSTTWGGKPISLESGKVARQADGSVIATHGETVVLCTAVAAKEKKPGQDFFPLTVNYQEKAFAAGKIPGGFFKREGRPSEKETLISRLIDRPIRPLFPDEFKNEVQVVCTVLAHDGETDTDVISMIGASAALTISGVPFFGPVAAAKVGYKDGEYLLNPTIEQLKTSELDLVVAGTSDAVMMVESEAKELSEDVMLGAVMYGHKQMQAIIDLIIGFAEQCAKDPWDLEEADNAELAAELEKLVGADLRAAYAEKGKQARHDLVDTARAKMTAHWPDADIDRKALLKSLFKGLEAKVVRGNILDTKRRIDGRDLVTVRPIVAEVGVLPRVHGSALFTRGETQALVVATLGTGQDEQVVDDLTGDSRNHYMLHYNFPPYSVGETGRMGSPGRREIGHGKLAWRATHPLLPSKDQFPYTIRVVSEITESNGSSSMASVCGASLAMMDAGVPLTRPVAGIAMGLIKEGDRFAVLSDILGDEDHLGDMDFKVAGTEAGVTALQMDIKIAGITEEIMRIALDQAKGGRIHILGEMAKGLGRVREEMRDTVPRVVQIQIPTDKIGAVIGPGGKVIREICEVTGAKIDISDDGTVKIASSDAVKGQQAVDWVRGLTSSPEVGAIYNGKVVRIVDFGAFVNFMGSQDGLLHISEIKNERINKVTDVLKEGDQVKVVILAIDDRGKVKLSMRAVDQETGERIEVERRPRREDGDNGEYRPERAERSDRGDRSERSERGDREGGFRRRGGDDRPRRPRED